MRHVGLARKSVFLEDRRCRRKALAFQEMLPYIVMRFVGSHDTELALPELPALSATQSVRSLPKGKSGDWLRSHNLEDLLQQPGGWRDRRRRLHLGKFVFPDRATYLSITNRTELLQNRHAGICRETPYWFKYDIATDQCEVDFCTEEDAQERINTLQRQQVPQCVIFAKYAFIAG